jgi:hypothetical protein
MAHLSAVLPRFEILADKPQHHRVNGNKPDLAALAFGAQVFDALAALYISEPQQAQRPTADAVIVQSGKNFPIQAGRGRTLQQMARMRIVNG